MARGRPTLPEILSGFDDQNRVMLARAITLVESTRPQDEPLREELLSALHDRCGKSRRVGISGVPGVGKSTFIESFGMKLVAKGKTLAVLAVDPSSTISGGSILGDKARMNRLAGEPNAFIRPSPSASSLGGVANRTRDCLLLCEAFGFDVVLVETVGVGQSETMVADMVDFFLVLMLPGAGDELQGIKRGILEIADLIAVNKADGALLAKAREAQVEYNAVLRYTRRTQSDWQAKALLASSIEQLGLDEIWQEIEEHHQIMSQSGALETRRREQLSTWLWHELQTKIRATLATHPKISGQLSGIEESVMDGKTSPQAAANQLLRTLGLIS